jgi:hypothetical protein
MHDPKKRCKYCGHTHIQSVTAAKCRRTHERRWTSSVHVIPEPPLLPWKPAETAPRDGKQFIAFDPRFGLMFTMHWSGSDFITRDETWSGVFTHWMPRPLAPQDESR